MNNKRTYKFKNNGKPFEITLDSHSPTKVICLYDGNLRVFDEDVISVELVCEESITGVVFKKKVQSYTVLVKYLFGSNFSKKEYTKSISIAIDEVSDAQNACIEASNMISLIKAKKEAYHKEQEEKLNKAKKEDTIDAIDVDGNEIKIWRGEVFFKDIVLFSEGGEVYHTHADCFESWKPVYRRKFTKWQLINKTEAKAQGLRECKLCENYYNDDVIEDEWSD